MIESSIEELSGRITELETLLGEANGELDIYKPFKEQYEEAAREIVRLKCIIEERTRIDKENMESLETFILNTRSAISCIGIAKVVRISAPSILSF